MSNKHADKSSPVRLGLMGLGGHGHTIQDAAGEVDGIDVAAVYDLDEGETEAAARRFGCDSVRSYEEMLNRDDLDAIALVTPNALHRSQTEAALAAGLDVFVEKPIANRVADGIAMVKAADEAGRVLAVGHNMRFSRSIVLARQRLEEGALGEPVTVEIHFSSDTGLRLPPASWRLRPEECPLMPVMQLGIHAIDVVHFLLRPIRSVFATSRSVVSPQGVPDSVTAAFRLDGGVDGTLISNYCTQIRFEIRISGTDATMTFTPHRIELRRTGDVDGLGDGPAETRDFGAFSRESYALQMEAFARAVRDRTRPAVDGRSALAALAVVEAMDESTRSGRVEQVTDFENQQDQQNVVQTA